MGDIHRIDDIQVRDAHGNVSFHLLFLWTVRFAVTRAHRRRKVEDRACETSREAQGDEVSIRCSHVHSYQGHEGMHAEILLILIASLVVAQVVLVQWKKRHFKSYQVWLPSCLTSSSLFRLLLSSVCG